MQSSQSLIIPMGTQTLMCGHLFLWSFGDEFHPKCFTGSLQKDVVRPRKRICIMRFVFWGSHRVFPTHAARPRLAATLHRPSLPEPWCLPLIPEYSSRFWFHISQVTAHELYALLISFITSLIYAEIPRTHSAQPWSLLTGCRDSGC